LVSFRCCAQQRKSTKRTTKTYTINDFIGTWKLTKYADLHLTLKKTPIQSETLIFTKDSIFVNLSHKKYSGVWKLEGHQPIIKIKGTKQFNYHWLGRGSDNIFFTTQGLGYYKYFERIGQ
jgi:ribosomal protein L27